MRCPQLSKSTRSVVGFVTSDLPVPDIFLRLHVILVTPHVEPVFHDRETHYRTSGFHQFLYQFGHVEPFPVRDVVTRGRLQKIHSCIDEERQRRLFPELRDLDVLAFHDSEGDLDLVFTDPDG